MAVNIANVQEMVLEYQNFKNSLFNGAQSLQNVLTVGATLYQNPNFNTIYPTDWPVYRTYLLNLQTLINNFIASVPPEPALNN
jgi:hypothetical protein